MSRSLADPVHYTHPTHGKARHRDRLTQGRTHVTHYRKQADGTVTYVGVDRYGTAYGPSPTARRPAPQPRTATAEHRREIQNAAGPARLEDRWT